MANAQLPYPNSDHRSRHHTELPPSLLVQAQRLASLRHPCIITLYGIIDEAGSCAMAVEFMRMGSLRSGMKLLQAQVRRGRAGGGRCSGP